MHHRVLFARQARSPDVDKIVFDGLRQGVWNIWSVSRTDKTQKKLTDYSTPNTRVLHPTWSARGGQIVYEKIRNRWIDEPNRKVIARKRLIKDIRANHLLRWIKTHFPEVPIVLLFRHPCAVTYSKMQLRWGTHLEEFLSQQELVEDFLGPFTDEIASPSNVFERHVLMWCIENYVPLRQFKKGEIHLVFYELLCTEPEAELERLFSFLGKSYSSKVLASIGMPSSLARRGQCGLFGQQFDEQLEGAYHPEAGQQSR